MIVYQVVTADDPEKLRQKVNARIESGWALFGGIAVAQSDFYSEDHKGTAKDNRSVIFAQTMTYK